jgi:hypothetical protein
MHQKSTGDFSAKHYSGHFALDSTDEIHLDEKSCGS